MKSDGLPIPGVLLRSAPGYVQVAPAGRGVCIPLFLHNDVMAVLAMFYFSLPSG